MGGGEGGHTAGRQRQEPPPQGPGPWAPSPQRGHALPGSRSLRPLPPALPTFVSREVGCGLCSPAPPPAQFFQTLQRGRREPCQDKSPSPRPRPASPCPPRGLSRAAFPRRPRPASTGSGGQGPVAPSWREAGKPPLQADPGPAGGQPGSPPGPPPPRTETRAAGEAAPEPPPWMEVGEPGSGLCAVGARPSPEALSCNHRHPSGSQAAGGSGGRDAPRSSSRPGKLSASRRGGGYIPERSQVGGEGQVRGPRHSADGPANPAPEF